MGEINNNMMTLIEILTNETQSLRKQYLELMGEWAAIEFARFNQVATAPFPKWDDFVQPSGYRKASNGQQYYYQDYDGQKRYRKACDARHAASQIVEQGFEAYREKMEKLAIRHYEESIQKLAARVEKKGLDLSTLKVKTSHIGVNIDTILTDGTHTVRAFTIIASGPIQRPHYRYLIK